MHAKWYGPRWGTLVSAVLIVVAHPPLEWHPLIWFGVVPWLSTLRRCASWREAVVQGFWLNFLLGLGGAFWVAYAVPQYLHVSLLFGVAATVLHATIHQLQLVAFAPLFHWLSKTGSATSVAGLFVVLVSALLYTGLDWIIPNLFHDTFGFVLHNYAAISQLAEFGGEQLLTFVVMVVNLLALEIVEAVSDTRRERPRMRPSVAVAALALVVVGAWGVGAQRESKIVDAISASTRRYEVGIVQGNVADDVKRRWAAGDVDAAKEALTAYLRASQQLLDREGRLAMIVWPETAYPGIFRRPDNEPQAKLNVAVDRFIANSGTPFVFGAYDREDRVDRRVLQNAIFLVEPRAGQQLRELSPMQVYHKHILFPVGETLPFIAAGERNRWLPNAGAFSRGAGARTFALHSAGGLRVGASICYEDLFASHAIELARQRADMIVNVSNDSWFGNYGLPQFHLIAAKLRSIETRLPQVRVTNTGYSALILPSGATRGVTSYGEVASRIWTVPVIERPETLMVRWGDWFGPASGLLAILGIGAARWSAI